jgi:hypothetical protein
MNDALKTLHDLLLGQHAALSDMLGNETDPNMAKTILNQMQELLHRSDLVQNFLFRQTSTQLEDAVKQVQTADASLTTALGNVKSASDLITASSQFFTYVDTAIDIAKTLAV